MMASSRRKVTKIKMRLSRIEIEVELSRETSMINVTKLKCKTIRVRKKKKKTKRIIFFMTNKKCLTRTRVKIVKVSIDQLINSISSFNIWIEMFLVVVDVVSYAINLN